MDVEEILKSSEIFFRPTGFWPSDNEKNPNWCRIKGYISMSFMIFGTLCMLCLQVSVASDPMTFAETSVTFAGFAIMAWKTTIFYGRRDTVLFLMVKMEKGKMNDDWIRTLHMSTKILNSFYGLLAIVYSITPLLLSAKLLPFDGNYPPIIYEEPWYEVVYVMEILLGLSALYVAIPCDMLLVLFVCQLCNDLNSTIIMMEQYGQYKWKLTDVIKQHIRTLNYGKILCDNVSVLFFGQNCIIAGALCVASYVALVTKKTVVLFKMIGVQLTITLLLFIYCYCGEIIFSTGARLRLMIEEHSWRSKDARVGKEICFVIQRAQTPLQVSVGSFGVMNLKFFSDSVYTAISYAMVLQTTTK